jgi:hypothetical protein
MTIDSPKGPEREARVWTPVEPTEQSAALAEALRHVGVVDPDDDCMSVFETTGEGIKHWVPVDLVALRLLESSPWSSEVERLTAEVEHHKRQHELWARLHTGEHEFVRSPMTQGEIGIWLVAESRELLRGMARRVGAWRRTSAQHYAEFYEAVQEWQRNDEQMLAENQRSSEEVSRLREQLATQALPPNASYRIAAKVMIRLHQAGFPLDNAQRNLLPQIVKDEMRAWSAPVSESVPATPRHQVDVLLDDTETLWVAVCNICGPSEASSFHAVRSMADQHEADTLRPTLTNESFISSQDEGRPSGSGAAAPHSGFKSGDLVRWNGDTGWFEGEILRPTSNETKRSGGWTMLIENMWDVAVTNLGTFYANNKRMIGWVVYLTEERIERIGRPQDAAQAARSEATPNPQITSEINMPSSSPPSGGDSDTTPRTAVRYLSSNCHHCQHTYNWHASNNACVWSGCGCDAFVDQPSPSSLPQEGGTDD